MRNKVLDTIRKRRVPFITTVSPPCSQISTTGTLVPGDSPSSVTSKEKLELMEMLRSGLSYSRAKRRFFLQTKKEVTLRSLARWASSTADAVERGEEPNFDDKRRVGEQRKHPRNKFTDGLVPYLERNLMPSRNRALNNDWRFWWVIEIRFLLVFRVLPVRAAIANPNFRNLQGVESMKRWPRRKWVHWYGELIRRRVAGERLSAEDDMILKQIQSLAALEVEPPFHRGLKFCERSIRASLENCYHENKSPWHTAKQHIWIRRLPSTVSYGKQRATRTKP